MTKPVSLDWQPAWLQHLSQRLFPFNCSLCGMDCEQDQPLCDDCRASLIRNVTPCPTCGLPLAHSAARIGSSECGRCLSKPAPFDAMIAPWLYDPGMARLIGQWKYQRKYWLTPLLAELWIQHYQSAACYSVQKAVDVLVPVPIAPMRLLSRGFNQARLLATEIQRRLPIENKPRIDHTLLTRARHANAQARLGAGARRTNIDHAFTVHRACDNLRVAVVDDVVTTATAFEIATQLKRRGAVSVEIWCIARTPLPERNPI